MQRRARRHNLYSEWHRLTRSTGGEARKNEGPLHPGPMAQQRRESAAAGDGVKRGISHLPRAAVILVMRGSTRLRRNGACGEPARLSLVRAHKALIIPRCGS